MSLTMFIEITDSDNKKRLINCHYVIDILLENNGIRILYKDETSIRCIETYQEIKNKLRNAKLFYNS